MHWSKTMHLLRGSPIDIVQHEWGKASVYISETYWLGTWRWLNATQSERALLKKKKGASFPNFLSYHSDWLIHWLKLDNAQLWTLYASKHMKNPLFL